MNLEIFITDYLSWQATKPVDSLLATLADSQMLRRANWQLLPSAPLQMLFQHLQAEAGRRPDCSATVASVLRQRLPAGPVPAFCLLPVSLGLQRDTFSLQSLPALDARLFQRLTQRMQQHFAADFHLIADDTHCFWWVLPQQPVQAEAGWPQHYLFQHAMAWQPGGQDASLLRQWTNEIQMLLHQWSAEAAQTEPWPLAFNSMWFASVPALPAWRQAWDVMIGQGVVFDGLVRSQVPAISQATLAASLQSPARQQVLMVADALSDVPWPLLEKYMQTGRLRQVRFTLPLAERSLCIDYQHADRWRFWRKRPTLAQHLDAILRQLPATTLANPPGTK